MRVLRAALQHPRVHKSTRVQFEGDVHTLVGYLAQAFSIPDFMEQVTVARCATTGRYKLERWIQTNIWTAHHNDIRLLDEHDYGGGGEYRAFAPSFQIGIFTGTDRPSTDMLKWLATGGLQAGGRQIHGRASSARTTSRVLHRTPPPSTPAHVKSCMVRGHLEPKRGTAGRGVWDGSSRARHPIG